MADQTRTERTYGNWRKPVAPGLGSMGLVGTVILFGGLIVSVLMMMLWLPLGAATAVLTGLIVVPLSIKDRAGRNLGQRATARVAFGRGRASGSALYRSGPLSLTGMGSFRLPGLAAASVMTEAEDSYGRKFGLIHVPGPGHYTAVLSCSADGAALVDQDQVDTWVAYWGAFLSSLAHEPALVAAQVVVETAPDPGTGLAREVTSRLSPNAPELARQMLGEVLETYPSGSAQVTTRIALTYAAAPRPGARRRDTAAMAREIGTRLPGLGEALAMTGAGDARPMSATALAEAVRVAYDPSVHQLIEQSQGSTGLTWENAGPAAFDDRWGHLVHDSAVSITWAMSEAPRGEVLSSVLTGLLAPHREIDRKRVAICYRPHDPATAARLVERDRRDAAFRLGARQAAARDLVAISAAEQAAREEARGAGLVRFALLVTATVTDPARLEAAAAAIDMLAPPARVALRRVYGSQASAFAAALPIGIVLPDHVATPQALREAL